MFVSLPSLKRRGTLKLIFKLHIKLFVHRRAMLLGKGQEGNRGDKNTVRAVHWTHQEQ